MKPETLSGFKNGMDRRYLETDTKLQSFWMLQNCHISNGNRIQKRGGMPLYQQMTEDTEGLFPFDGRLWTFQANNDSNAVQYSADAPEIWTVILNHEGTITQVHYVGVLLGGLYCSIEFEVSDGEGGTNQVIAHYYIVTGSEEWTAGREFTENFEGVKIAPLGTINEANKTVTLPYYYAAEPLRNARGSDTEPEWPANGLTVTENDVVWTGVPLVIRDPATQQTFTYDADGVYCINSERAIDQKTYRAWKIVNEWEAGDALESAEAEADVDEQVKFNYEIGSITPDGPIQWECVLCVNWVTGRTYPIDWPLAEDKADEDNPTLALAIKSPNLSYEQIFVGRREVILTTGATEPEWPVVDGAIVEDGNIDWKANSTEVLDENCPNTAEVLIFKSKVYAIGSNIGSDDEADIVRYSATNAPFDWTTERDAGFLPTGAQSSGSEIARALGRYDSKLVVMMEDNIEIWAVDEDPELNRLFQGIGNLGTTYSDTGIGIGTDFLFLSPAGFRSLGAREGSMAFEDTDVGTPIDAPVVEAIEKTSQPPVANLFTSEGQYWCSIGNEIWVWTYSRNSEVNAWSVYPITEDIRYMAQLNERLYIRTVTDKVLVVNKNVFSDHDGLYTVDVDFMYQSLKDIGMMKQFHGFDMLMNGEAEVSFGYDGNSPDDESPSMLIEGNTRSGQMNPMEIMATEVSPRIRYTGPNNLRIDAISLYFTTLGLM